MHRASTLNGFIASTKIGSVLKENFTQKLMNCKGLYGRKFKASSAQHNLYSSQADFVDIMKPPTLTVNDNLTPLPHDTKCRHSTCLSLCRTYAAAGKGDKRQVSDSDDLV